MKKQAVVDRFEGDFLILEAEPHETIRIPRSHAPTMAGEGMVVWYEGDRILEIDTEETQRREASIRRRFERILGKK